MPIPVVENDTRIGRIMDKVRALGLDKNTYVFWTTDNGAWQDVYPDAGYTPFRGTKGTVREGGNRVPSIAWGPGIKAGTKNSDMSAVSTYMATFAKLAGVKLPENDREGQPIIFDSYDMSPVLSERESRSARAGSTSPRTNLRRAQRESATTRPCSICGAMMAPRPAVSRLIATWAGRERSQYVATVPQVFDLWAGPAGALRHLHEQLHGATPGPWSRSTRRSRT